MTTAYREIESAPVLGSNANAIAINYVNVQPFNSATIYYDVRVIQQTTIMGPNNVEVPGPPIMSNLMSSSLTLSGAEYSAWGDDDTYLYEKVAAKNGLTLIPDSLPAN